MLLVHLFLPSKIFHCYTKKKKEQTKNKQIIFFWFFCWLLFISQIFFFFESERSTTWTWEHGTWNMDMELEHKHLEAWLKPKDSLDLKDWSRAQIRKRWTRKQFRVEQEQRLELKKKDFRHSSFKFFQKEKIGKDKEMVVTWKYFAGWNVLFVFCTLYFVFCTFVFCLHFFKSLHFELSDMSLLNTKVLYYFDLLSFSFQLLRAFFSKKKKKEKRKKKKEKMTSRWPGCIYWTVSFWNGQFKSQLFFAHSHFDSFFFKKVTSLNFTQTEGTANHKKTFFHPIFFLFSLLFLSLNIQKKDSKKACPYFMFLIGFFTLTFSLHNLFFKGMSSTMFFCFVFLFSFSFFVSKLCFSLCWIFSF